MTLCVNPSVTSAVPLLLVPAALCEMSLTATLLDMMMRSGGGIQVRVKCVSWGKVGVWVEWQQETGAGLSTLTSCAELAVSVFELDVPLSAFPFGSDLKAKAFVLVCNCPSSMVTWHISAHRVVVTS